MASYDREFLPTRSAVTGTMVCATCCRHIFANCGAVVVLHLLTFDERRHAVSMGLSSRQKTAYKTIINKCIFTRYILLWYIYTEQLRHYDINVSHLSHRTW
jgi:hypothetical protein